MDREEPVKAKEGSVDATRKETFWTREVVALVSCVSVCVLVLIPVWYKTTEVYRSPLPYAEIESFSTQPVCLMLMGVFRAKMPFRLVRRYLRSLPTLYGFIISCQNSLLRLV